MDKLKGIFYTVFILLFCACDPVEPEFTYDEKFLDIYTVKYGNALVPELYADSTIYVSNFSDYGLKFGDRVTLVLHYHLNAYDSKDNYVNIVELVEKIPTLSITPRETEDDAEYDLPLGVRDYMAFKPYIWVWNNRLNVNALFAANPETTSFRMSLRGVANDTIMMDLLAKADEPLEEKSTKLLSYDLVNLEAMFTDAEKEALKSFEKLKFRIYMKEKNKDGKLLDRPYNTVTGEYANPLY